MSVLAYNVNWSSHVLIISPHSPTFFIKLLKFGDTNLGAVLLRTEHVQFVSCDKFTSPNLSSP